MARDAPSSSPIIPGTGWARLGVAVTSNAVDRPRVTNQSRALPLISGRALDQLPVSFSRAFTPCYGSLSPLPKWGRVPWNSPVNVKNLGAPEESRNTSPRVAVN